MSSGKNAWGGIVEAMASPAKSFADQNNIPEQHKMVLCMPTLVLPLHIMMRPCQSNS